ncbi:MAG: hypothetical protein LQ344_001308 [Seirophora lacunosa]|nr:MAG: hypothetical protein LQ344_001308 [Seirophora lacunosa]
MECLTLFLAYVAPYKACGTLDMLDMLEEPVTQDAPSKPKPVNSVADVTRTLSLAEKFAFNQQKPDGHWCGEFRAQVYPTAQYVIFHQAWGTNLSADASQLRKYLLSLQASDGSWSIAPDYPGDISPTAEAYLALRILDHQADSKELLRARDFIRKAGGLAKVRILTRFLLAQFGLFPWKAVPQVPPELMLLPTWAPVNIFSLPYFSRHAVLPLAIIRHHEPIFALPNGRSASNAFLDELWLDPRRKSAPYGRSFLDLSMNDPVGFALKAADYLVHALRVLRYSPVRYLARKQIVKWLLQHQNKDGSWSGFTLAFQCAVTALLLEGFTVNDTPIRRGLAALETWTVADDVGGKRIQLCTSPIWDTTIMLEALCVTGIPPDDGRLQRAADWLKAQQLFGPDNDVALYCSDLQTGGGWAFQYDNSWIPDVDDTTAVILGLFAQDPNVLDKYCPFNDTDNLVDPSTADITCRMLELCTVIIRRADSTHGRPPAHLVRRAQQAVPGIIRFITSTSLAISALAPYVEKGGRGPVGDMVRQGAAFIIGQCSFVYITVTVFNSKGYSIASDVPVLSKGARNGLLTRRLSPGIQHSDGGWGETIASYDVPAPPKGQGESLPSSTGWALLGLLAAGLDPLEPVIQQGVRWLVDGQTDVDGSGGASWPEWQFTGVGFIGKVYLGYSLYRHYFPMLALGKYMLALTATTKGGDEKAALLS